MDGMSPLALALLLVSCVPDVDPAAEAPLIYVESHGRAWALHDDVSSAVPPELAGVPHACDASGCEYEPRSYVEAVAAAKILIQRSDRSPSCSTGRAVCAAGVDVGIGQLNSTNFARLGVDVESMLRPCPNLRASSALLNAMYQEQYAAVRAASEEARVQMAERRTYQVYNSGRPFGAPAYLDRIIEAAHQRYVLTTISIARALRRTLGFVPAGLRPEAVERCPQRAEGLSSTEPGGIG